MAKVTLGFKAFDAHELLCHFMAVEAGLYRSEGIEVELVDLTFFDEPGHPPHWYQASCGAALVSALKGFPQRVFFVAVDRPMFWIWARAPLADLAGLAGGRIATFAATAPPHRLANIVLQQAGLNPMKDVALMPARDDVARVGLLRSGSADAALLSSAVPPARMRALDFNRLCFIGDALRLPTTGLAVHPAQIERAPAEVSALAAIHTAGLRLIHADPELTATVLRDWFDVGADIARATSHSYAAAFTENGRTTPDIAQGAIDSICASLGTAESPAWDRIYDWR
jgi:NitT/TauT family transport system substrate-binding protein